MTDRFDHGDGDYTEEIVVVHDEDERAIREIAANHGVDVNKVPSVGLEPVTTVTLIIGGSVLAVGAVTYLLEKRKGGQVIDLRPGVAKTFYRSSDVVYGTVVIITVDGRVTVDVKEPKGFFVQAIEAIATATEASDASAEGVKSAIAEALGERAQLEVEKN